MRKIIILAIGMMVLAVHAFAAQRMLVVSNGRDDEIKEVNYYLVNGGKVVHMVAAGKPDATRCYIVVEYPDSLPLYVKK